MSQENSKPVKSYKAANIEASVWENFVEQDGETKVRHSVKIQKQFRKSEGNYEKTAYFFRDDLPKLIIVAQKAFEFISLKESKDAEESIPV